MTTKCGLSIRKRKAEVSLQPPMHLSVDFPTRILCTCQTLSRISLLTASRSVSPEKFVKKFQHSKYPGDGDKGYLLFEFERKQKYENTYPGTVTGELFGIECWDYEARTGSRGDNTIFIIYAKMPESPEKKLLSGLDELRRGMRKFGWWPDLEEADLTEMVGEKVYAHQVRRQLFGDSLDSVFLVCQHTALLPAINEWEWATFTFAQSRGHICRLHLQAKHRVRMGWT
jgi:hypothetical protein